MSEAMKEAFGQRPGKEIYGLMPRVMADIGAVEKTRKNPQQGYMFRGIDDFYGAVHSALSRHGVFPIPIVQSSERQERTTQKGGLMFHVVLRVATRFYAPDGSYVEAITIGEAMDTSDKASNKAMSAAMKYALIETFCIPTDDNSDTENDTYTPYPFPSRDAGSHSPGASSGGGRTPLAGHAAQGDPGRGPNSSPSETAGHLSRPPPDAGPKFPSPNPDSPGETGIPSSGVPVSGRPSEGPVGGGDLSEEEQLNVLLTEADTAEQAKSIGVKAKSLGYSKVYERALGKYRRLAGAA